METYTSPIIALLSKFSNSIWILQYYGYFKTGKSMMINFGSDTNHCWYDNQHLYEQYLTSKRKTLKNTDGTSDEFGDFLIYQQRFKLYELDLLINGAGIEAQSAILDKFIEKLGEDAKYLRFKRVRISGNFKDKDKFEEFISNYGYIFRPSCINYTKIAPKSVNDKWFISSSTNEPLFVFLNFNPPDFSQYKFKTHESTQLDYGLILVDKSINYCFIQ